MTFSVHAVLGFPLGTVFINHQTTFQVPLWAVSEGRYTVYFCWPPIADEAVAWRRSLLRSLAKCLNSMCIEMHHTSTESVFINACHLLRKYDIITDSSVVCTPPDKTDAMELHSLYVVTFTLFRHCLIVVSICHIFVVTWMFLTCRLTILSHLLIFSIH